MALGEKTRYRAATELVARNAAKALHNVQDAVERKYPDTTLAERYSQRLPLTATAVQFDDAERIRSATATYNAAYAHLYGNTPDKPTDADRAVSARVDLIAEKIGYFKARGILKSIRAGK